MLDNVQLNQVNQIDNSSVTNINSTGDIQLMFAQLQMELASTNKESAMEKIAGIKRNQAEVKSIVDSVNELRSAIADLKDDDKVVADKIKDLDKIAELCDKLGIECPLRAECKEILQAIEYLETAKDMCISGKYFSKGEVGCMDRHNIPHLEEIRNAIRLAGVDPKINGVDVFGVQDIGWYTLNTYHFTDMIDRLSANSVKNIDATVTEVKTLIANLEAKKDTIGSDVQQEMVLIQDFMGKYSAYTNGATAQLSKHADTLTSVATGR